MITARPSVATVLSADAYRIVAVVAAASGNTYAQYSPKTEGFFQIVGHILSKSNRRTNTHPSNISLNGLNSAVVEALPSPPPSPPVRRSFNKSNETTPTDGGAINKNIAGDPLISRLSCNFPNMKMTISM
eukprot:CAMPEP_0201645488 /NCGR_PEP_ID=MMETSP0493-20130528/32225_1 /ASSEMBLY_ACC=CAM_ASM_000838 /TAXON_ID=420259 /ORGANISM="Thalassiosira gravida, Strain GMp14c1" /LENGTH=129 /DNA_ID=CAMNT_0048120441 /DNA_START=55 /DNA_END=444 /DNA_ORIENTATION=-